MYTYRYMYMYIMHVAFYFALSSYLYNFNTAA